MSGVSSAQDRADGVFASRVREIVGDAHLTRDPDRLEARRIDGVRPGLWAVPADAEQIAALLTAAAAAGAGVIPRGGGAHQHLGTPPSRADLVVETTRLTGITDYTPADYVVAVRAGTPFRELQQALAANGQWLPLDPPGADTATIGGLVAANRNGPRRLLWGSIRDLVIGIRVALPTGEVIKAGGKVVKNVAGYDLAKLFIGSRGSLGIVVEATFKLRPLPEAESFVQAQFESLDEAGRRLEQVLDSDVMPTVLDLHNLAGALSPFALVIGFAGTEPDVKWQLERVAALGVAQPATLDYERVFWNGATPDATGIAPEVQKISVLPSKVVETLRIISGPFVARAGNGVIFHRGKSITQAPETLSTLGVRLKQTWDPKNILPPPPS